MGKEALHSLLLGGREHSTSGQSVRSKLPSALWELTGPSRPLRPTWCMGERSQQPRTDWMVKQNQTESETKDLPFHWRLACFLARDVHQAPCPLVSFPGYSPLKESSAKTKTLNQSKEISKDSKTPPGKTQLYGTPLQYSCLENPMGGGAW